MWLQETPMARLLRCNRSAVTKKFAFFDDLHHLRRDHSLPAAVSRLQFSQRVRRMNSQVFGMIISDLLNVLIVDQISEQRTKIRRDVDLFCADDLSSAFIDHWVNVKF